MVAVAVNWIEPKKFNACKFALIVFVVTLEKR